MSEHRRWSVRVSAYVTSDADVQDVVMRMSRAIAEVGGDNGAWGGYADPPDARRSVGALWHVDAPRVGRAVELAVELMQAACARAALPIDELVEVTVSPHPAH